MRSKGRMDAAAAETAEPVCRRSAGASRDAVAFCRRDCRRDLDLHQHAVPAAGPASGADGQEQRRRDHAASRSRAEPDAGGRQRDAADAATARAPRRRPSTPRPRRPRPCRRLRPRPAARAPSTAVVADIQRELSRRGFYDGVVDGRYGPRTDASIRDFEQAAGLKPSTAPDEALLRAIQRSTVRSQGRPCARRRRSRRRSPIRSAT